MGVGSVHALVMMVVVDGWVGEDFMMVERLAGGTGCEMMALQLARRDGMSARSRLSTPVLDDN